MGALDWGHNAHYGPLLLSLLPARCERALDVGCGAGGFTAELARRVPHVDAVDSSPEMVARARAAVPPGVHVHEADVLRWAPSGRYDAVPSVPALPHLPLEPGLCLLYPPSGSRRELASGGEKGVLQLVSTVGHRVIGARRRLRGELRPAPDGMPVRDAELTVREVRARASAVLPGVEVRRLRYGRYLLVWRRPG